MICATDGCERTVYCRGVCDRCYARWHRSVYTPPPTPPCVITGCANQSKARGLCNRHYIRRFYHGDPTVTLKVDALPTRGLLGWLRDRGYSDRWIGEQLGMSAQQAWAMRTGQRKQVMRRTAQRVRRLAERVGEWREVAA